jgi:hypothetical protein
MRRNAMTQSLRIVLLVGVVGGCEQSALAPAARVPEISHDRNLMRSQ